MPDQVYPSPSPALSANEQASRLRSARRFPNIQPQGVCRWCPADQDETIDRRRGRIRGSEAQQSICSDQRSTVSTPNHRPRSHACRRGLKGDEGAMLCPLSNGRMRSIVALASLQTDDAFQAVGLIASPAFRGRARTAAFDSSCQLYVGFCECERAGQVHRIVKRSGRINLTNDNLEGHLVSARSRSRHRTNHRLRRLAYHAAR